MSRFLIAWSTTGQQRGRIGYPLLTPEHTAALPAALDDLRRFLATAGATWARLDLSETRPDQHAAAVAAGWVQHWTYVQMAKRLTRGHRIPVRRRVEPRPEAVDFPAHPGDPPVLV